MAKETKRLPKKKIQTRKKKTKKLQPSKKIYNRNQKKNTQKKNKNQKNKKNQKEEQNFELERDKLLAELTEDEYNELLFEEDIENMPHDIFDTYDEPQTEKENNEYVRYLIDDSDVILYVLDARDVLYFRQKFRKKNKFRK